MQGRITRSYGSGNEVPAQGVTIAVAEGTDVGGSDSGRGSVRFLQWIANPNPDDNTYVIDFAIIIRDRRGRARVEHDRHVQGLFPRARWLRLLRDVGFKAGVVRDGEFRDAFLGRRPSTSGRSRAVE